MSFQKQKHLEWKEGSTGGRGGERKNGRILSLLRKLCFWKASLTQKSPSTHLLRTRRAISSLAAPLQGEDNVQLLFASSNGLGELWGAAQRGRARQGPARQGPARQGPARQGPARQGPVQPTEMHSGCVQVALLSLIPPQG